MRRVRMSAKDLSGCRLGVRKVLMLSALVGLCESV